MRSSRKIKVVIDGRFAQGGGGIGRYVREMAKGLARNGYEVIVVGDRDRDSDRVKMAPGVRSIILQKIGHWIVWEQIQLPILLRRLRPDVYHAAGNWGVPVFCPCPVVLTIHDIIPLTIAGYFRGSKIPGLSRWLYWLRMKVGLRRARVVMCDSKEVGREIASHFKFNGKVKVVPLGVSNEFFKKGNRSKDIRVLRSLGIEGSYLLSHGGIDSRKNNEGVVRALSLTKSVKKLVITGRNQELENGLKELAEKLGLGDQAIFCGWVTGEEIAVLARCAEAVIYPTLAEGFGLPVVEAMAAGVPIIASDIPVLRSIGKDVPIYVNPESVESIAKGITLAIRLPRLPKSPRLLRGKVRARGFKWKRVVAEVERVYSEVLGD